MSVVPDRIGAMNVSPPPIRVASWNCAGGFRNKVDRVLDLDADVYVIQEAEPVDGYLDRLPGGASHYFERRPEYPKGLLVFTRPGWTVVGRNQVASTYAHVAPLIVVRPDGGTLDLRAVWTLDAKPREAAYVGQAHLALDDIPHAVNGRSDRVAIGDYNSNSIWDAERRRHHTTLVERMEALGMPSAYHGFTGEAQGSEAQPTFFLQRNASKPFHIDHCFTDMEVADVQVGTFADWSGLKADGGVSDHCPLVVSLRPSQWSEVAPVGVPASLISQLVSSTAWTEAYWGETVGERFQHHSRYLAFIAGGIVGQSPDDAAKFVSNIGQNMGGGLPFEVFDELRRLVEAL